MGNQNYLSILILVILSLICNVTSADETDISGKYRWTIPPQKNPWTGKIQGSGNTNTFEILQEGSKIEMNVQDQDYDFRGSINGNELIIHGPILGKRFQLPAKVQKMINERGLSYTLRGKIVNNTIVDATWHEYWALWKDNTLDMRPVVSEIILTKLNNLKNDQCYPPTDVIKYYSSLKTKIESAVQRVDNLPNERIFRAVGPIPEDRYNDYSYDPNQSNDRGIDLWNESQAIVDQQIKNGGTDDFFHLKEVQEFIEKLRPLTEGPSPCDTKFWSELRDETKHFSELVNRRTELVSSMVDIALFVESGSYKNIKKAMEATDPSKSTLIKLLIAASKIAPLTDELSVKEAEGYLMAVKGGSLALSSMLFTVGAGSETAFILPSMASFHAVRDLQYLVPAWHTDKFFLLDSIERVAYLSALNDIYSEIDGDALALSRAMRGIPVRD